MALVEIAINNVVARLRASDPSIYTEVDRLLSYYPEGYRFMRKYRSGVWDGRIHLLSRRDNTFPAGLVPRVASFLAEKGVEVRCFDRRSRPAPDERLLGGLTEIVLRPDQIEAVEAALTAGRGVIEAATGVGKTVILGELLRRLAVPTLVLMHRRELVYQTLERFERTLWFPNASGARVFGIIGDGVWEPGLITIGSYMTIYAWLQRDRPAATQWLAQFKALFADEAHHVPAKSFTKVCAAMSEAFFRYGCCLAIDTPIVLADGTTKAIQDVRPGDRVWAFSPDDQKLQIARVRGAWSNGITPRCLVIRLASGRHIRATDEHLFFETAANQHRTAQWLRAGQLKPGHHLLRLIAFPAEEPELDRHEVLRGSLAGDGCLARGGWYTESHCEAQADYADWKARQLGATFRRYQQRQTGFGKEQQLACLRIPRADIDGDQLRVRYYPNGRKRISNIVADFLTWQAIAVWIMDDGCWTGGRRNVIDLSLGNIAEDDAHEVAALLYARWGLAPRLAQVGDGARYWRLYFSVADTAKIIENCAAYVPSVMRHKFGCKVGESAALIRDTVIEVSPSVDLPTYDLSIEGPPTFFANGIGVHNSATAFKSDKGSELRVVAATGEIVFSFGPKAAIEEGILVPPKIYMIDPGFEKLDGYDELTGRYLYGWAKEYRDGIVEHRRRNALIARCADAAAAAKQPTLVLLQHLAQGRNILRYFEEGAGYAEFYHGSHSTSERNRALKRLGSGRLPILLSSVIMEEGVDLPALGMVIMAGGYKAKHKALQRVGRGLRAAPGKSHVVVIDFLDRHGDRLYKHSRSRLAAYKNAGFEVEILSPEALWKKMTEPDFWGSRAN